MALTYTTSYSASVANLMSLPVYQLDPGTIVVISDDPGVVKESLTSAPLDRPEIWEFASRAVDNVYKDSTVPVIARPTSSRGVQIMIKHGSFTTVTDSDDSTYYKVLPMASWTCVRVPLNELITADLVLDEIKRLTGGLLGTEATSARLAEMVRGALKP